MSSIVMLTAIGGSANVNGKQIQFSYAEVRKDDTPKLTPVFTIEGLALRDALALIGAGITLGTADAPSVAGLTATKPAPVATKPAEAKPAAPATKPAPVATKPAAPAVKPAAVGQDRAPVSRFSPPTKPAAPAPSRFGTKPAPAPEPEEPAEDADGFEDDSKPNKPCGECGDAPEITGTGICAGCLASKEEMEVPAGLAEAKKLRDVLVFFSENAADFGIKSSAGMISVCARFRPHVNALSVISEDEFDARIERGCELLGLFEG